MKHTRILLLVVACVACALDAYGQSEPIEKTPYYINVNEVSPGDVFEISDFLLHLEYREASGTSKTFPLKIYDWKHTLLTTLTLDKFPGLNHYTIKLEDVYSAWELNKAYTAEFRNEEGTAFKIPIMLVEKLKNDPVVGIIVNPIVMGCDDVSQSLIEFYGEIQGGRAPYTVSWFVLNDSRTEFLYQPKEEVIAMPGKTSVIKVDRNPEYYVVLFVKDACGEEQRQVVNMVCGKTSKKINTVFVEEFTTPLKPIK